MGLDLDIGVGLSGRDVKGWDERMRPVPKGAQIVDLRTALADRRPYAVVVAHTLTDLLEVKSLNVPKLLVLHGTIEGRSVEQNSPVGPQQMRAVAAQYLNLTGAHAVAISELKRASWALTGDVLRPGLNTSDYPLASLERACGVRVVNHMNRRRQILRADLHEEAFGGLPLELIGINDDIPGVTPSADWADLKTRLARSRFYVHTADERFEDGYNLASLEAMACGLPILGNLHPSSPIIDGVHGYLSNDPMILRRHAESLLNDIELARELGRAARARVESLFSHSSFKVNLRACLARAIEVHQGQCPALSEVKGPRGLDGGSRTLSSKPCA
ncbi:MAG: hypothetical protein JKY61_05750 [Planctomycetes bacterium]|nr:hypothetical protein [Planctomycetota bacterium]